VSDTLEPLTILCPRCGGTKVPVHVLGQTRYRCERPECEAYRVHRRQQQQASATKIERGPLYLSPGRPSVEEQQYHYLHPNGEGFKAALDEARAILEVGGSVEEAAEWIGFTIRQLREALDLVKLGVSDLTSTRTEIAATGIASEPARPHRHRKAALPCDESLEGDARRLRAVASS
jgi:hypothetical protein